MTPQRIARLQQVLRSRQPDLTVLTDFVHKQRNLSAIVRNCDAVGIMQVHAVLGDKDYQAFRGTAMGSHRWVKVRRHRSLNAALQAPALDSLQWVAAHLDEGAVDFRDVDYTRPTVILLGAERGGLSDAAQRQADVCVNIPMVGMVGSLNVSVACGIILAEAQRQRQLGGFYEQQRIDAATYQRLFFEWGHPAVRDFCRERGLRYPALDENGEIDNPSGWYASVKKGSAARYEGKDNE